MKRLWLRWTNWDTAGRDVVVALLLLVWLLLLWWITSAIRP